MAGLAERGVRLGARGWCSSRTTVMCKLGRPLGSVEWVEGCCVVDFCESRCDVVSKKAVTRGVGAIVDCVSG